MIEGQETKVMSVRDAIIEAMSEEMRRDENVFLMGEDVGVYGGDFGTSVGMLEEFGVLCPLSSAVLLARVWALLLSTLRVSNHGSATSLVSRS